MRDAYVDVNGNCVEGPWDPNIDHRPFQAWIEIAAGQVTGIVVGCDPLRAVPTDGSSGSGSMISSATHTSNLPPAYPAPDSGIWPYGEFWNVPQLGREPVRGSGCGSSGHLGERIPDGVWSGNVGHDAAANGYWIDLVCIYYGDGANQIRSQGTSTIVSDQPDYLIVNNSDQGRFVPSDLAAYVIGGPTANGACAEAAHLPPTDHSVVANNSTKQAWIRIHNGHVTWVFYGC